MPATKLPFDLPIVPPGGIAPLYEFHILADVRTDYAFDEMLYGFNGNVVFANFHAVRLFAKKMNDHRDLVTHPERAVRAGDLNAMGLIDEISHFMIRRYEEKVNPGVFARAAASLKASLSEQGLFEGLRGMCRAFPPRDVYKKSATEAEYLAGTTSGKPHVEVTLEEVIMLWLANINPAFAPFHELFNDVRLRNEGAYPAMLDAMQVFFRNEAPSGPGGQSLFELLREPMLASPHTLAGQLAYMRKHWGVHLSKHFLDKLSGAGDLIREESKSVVPGGTPESVVPRYGPESHHGDVDSERFTTDLEWMPNVVILAKNTYVWLDQLSKKYRRPIRTLNEIPDVQLDELARWNFTGLWLIGVWERSPASKTMKQLMGNPEAVASAYSVYEYVISADLGGEEAFQDLRHRAWQRGIRLAGDMVPNHVGMYSKWIVEHPDYFIQSSYPPFPNYAFTGHNFSSNPHIELRIEDGYWTRSDAAVVFQRIDTSNGETRYIYHGNDGTSFPWNDTAQLNYLRSEVREEVIREIFHVAEKFSIIRFDAAMVLAKKHFQRLWYPVPGSGGDIPSRADHAMSAEEFDRAFPVEFWREVVDRINRDKPNTLLLAEAFWLLEGYFVRTLGMHRVYNSAFMHMMMKEENAKYRKLIYNTLAYNPEILKRYVNFMSNPDERTAVDQFGKDDKYFGVAVLMVTLPGLPMFAHGQVEGYTEKYGMEYQRAYVDESPDGTLVARHEREIFPLLNMRYLFSQVEHFELYDFIGAEGGVNENVFVYSNVHGGERALVCYNNRYERSAGRIGRSVSKINANGEESRGKSVGESLGVNGSGGYFYILREHRSGLEYLRSGAELCSDGFQILLRGFEYQLFLGFREVVDTSGEYAALAEHLRGEGRPNIGEALRDLQLLPVHSAFRLLLDDESVKNLEAYLFAASAGPTETMKTIAATEKRYLGLLQKIQEYMQRRADVKSSTNALVNDVQQTHDILQQSLKEKFPLALPADLDRVKLTRMIMGVLVTLRVGEFMRLLDKTLRDRSGAEGEPSDILRLRTMWESASFHRPDGSASGESVLPLIALLTKFHGVMTEAALRRLAGGFLAVLEDPGVKEYLHVHEFEGVLFYKKEAFDELIEWLGFIALVRSYEENTLTSSKEMTIFKSVKEVITRLRNLSNSSEYRYEALLVKLRKIAPAPASPVPGGDHPGKE